MGEQGNKSAIFICLPANLSELSKGGESRRRMGEGYEGVLQSLWADGIKSVN